MSIRTNAFATNLLLFARRNAEAIALAQRGLEFEPNAAFTLAFLGVAYADEGRFAEAVEHMRKAAALDSSPTIVGLQAHVLALDGQPETAVRLIRGSRIRQSIATSAPTKSAPLCDPGRPRDRAYACFRKGVDGRAECMAWLGVEPWIQSFRIPSALPDTHQGGRLDPRPANRAWFVYGGWSLVFSEEFKPAVSPDN